MEREIKFRAKRLDNRQWVYGYYFVDLENKKHYIHLKERDNTVENWMVKSFEVISESVGQFTGLKDKNGVEIYEGDIVLADWHFDTPTLVSLNYKDSFFYAVQEYVLDDVMEVIGNVFNNQELLK